jgi:uncharacterized protein (DUF2141 family)
MNHKSTLIFLIFQTAWLFLVSCASQAPPPGGPVDKSPPLLISVEPENGSVNIPLRPEISLVFDENIDLKTAVRAVTIFPVLAEMPNIHISKRTLSISFKEDLQPDQTYILVITRGLSDTRGNSLQEPISIAFSTGDHIAAGEISGMVYYIPARKTITLFLYNDSTSSVDSLLSRQPDYITQTNAEGQYRFRYLSAGTYRIFAVFDQDKDRVYSPKFDKLSLCPFAFITIYDTTSVSGDLSGDSLEVTRFTNRTDVNFIFTEEDFKLPVVVSTEQIGRTMFKLKYSKSMDLSMAEFFAGTRQDSDRLALQWVTGNITQNVVFLYTGTLDTGEYRIYQKNLRDWAGNPLLDTDSLILGITGEFDTIPPAVVMQRPISGDKGVFPGSLVLIRFDRPVGGKSVIKGMSITKNDTPEFNLSKSSPWDFKGVLPEDLPFNEEVTLELDISRVVAENGYGPADSLFRYRIFTANPDTFGSITGYVAPPGVYRMSLLAVETFEDIQSMESDSLGKYEFSNVPGGEYRVMAFRDIDGNGRYSPGRFYPDFQPAEPFVIHPDIISVRPRWETGGVNLKIEY